MPARGIPRINPVKDLRSGVRQFIVIDPGGNYVRIGQRIGELTNGLATGGRRGLAHVLETAVILADSHDDPLAATRVLTRVLDRAATDGPEPAELRFRGRVMRADLAVRLGEDELARQLLAGLAGTEPDGVPDELRRTGELREQLGMS
ncbi:hypothetical protein [Amycolatopsis cihanbeyliensis]|uniref:hypothetical protein n=1 Tax=Amycolatopsis cihanbeyliensis TaxID=1128664 RepID=UPI001151412D|nr:hypothetical protein [Amycolatopsis cihanbeyliensis]